MYKRSDEEIIAQPIQVKGIGRWTAEMFLIFCLGRLDVLPVTDLGIRKAMLCKHILFQSFQNQQRCYLSLNHGSLIETVATWYLSKSLSEFHSIG
jgi:DNA-3-methyladenine glycosylase II